VTLTGSGFTPGYAVSVQQCTSTKVSSCDFTTGRAVTAGLHGDFALTSSVRRTISVYTPTGLTSVNCAAAAGTCNLTVRGTASQPTKALALDFDPNAPAVAPAITANPNTGLTDNQSIPVSLDGFVPNQPVQLIECSAEAVSGSGNLSYCDYTTIQTTTPTVLGTFQTSFVVRAAVGGQGGLVDCTSQAGACVLLASETVSYYGGGYGASPSASPNKVGVATLPNTAFTPLSFSTG